MTPSFRPQALQCSAAFLIAWQSILFANDAFAQLRITEVMYNPIDDSIWEWIEVRNFGSQPVNLNGSIARRMGDSNVANPAPTINASLDPDTTINPGEIAIIYDGEISSDGSLNFNDTYFRQAWKLGPSVKLIGADSLPSLTNTAGSPGRSIGFWATAADWRADQTGDKTASFAHALFSLDFSSASFPQADGKSIAWSGSGNHGTGSNWYLSNSGINGAVTSSAVSIPGFINSDDDIGNPGIKPPGTSSVSGLQVTEVMFDPASPDDDWEWIELYNNSASSISLAGYTLDDVANPVVTSPNIAGGNIAAGGLGILFNADDVTAADFAAAWGSGLNLIPVTNWSRLTLNNTGDTITLKNTFGLTVLTQDFMQSSGFPNPPEGASLSLKDLSLNPATGSNWAVSASDDSLGSFAATLVSGGEGGIPLHLGGDVGSPGTFISADQPSNSGDFDGDGDVDGRDFLRWQRGGSPVPYGIQDLNDWKSSYGAGLSAIHVVPEPAAITWVFLASTGLTLARFTFRNQHRSIRVPMNFNRS